MARAKKAPAKQEVSRKEINGNIIIIYDDGTATIIPAPIELTAEQVTELFGSEEADEEEEDEDVDDDDDDIDTDFIDDTLQEEVDRPTDPRWDALKKLKR